MKTIKYFFQFLIIIFLFLLFKILGLRLSSNISYLIVKFLGPFFRSKKIISSNILRAFPNLNKDEIKKISKEMWGNYGRILSEYIFIKYFRKSKSNSKYNLEIHGQEILDQIKIEKQRVIFISGHFNNFELMAMQIEKSGINLAAIYRPLNNKFLNYFMEKIRKKYICKNQIKKGISGTKKLLTSFKKGSSIALMIDQRVSQGIKSNFFNQEALTTTIPAQFVKKFNCKIVPIYIERVQNINFRLIVHAPIEFTKDETIATITLQLNSLLEKMILKNPSQWIWSHNRWK
ncbi:lysophospholipid acyltransferase family protein [Candidatus Pelagibacter sp.]|nr:lysophospholipid acyltransferase family protein [Candidatus Pelagibacter sp.]